MFWVGIPGGLVTSVGAAVSMPFCSRVEPSLVQSLHTGTLRARWLRWTPPGFYMKRWRRGQGISFLGKGRSLRGVAPQHVAKSWGASTPDASAEVLWLMYALSHPLPSSTYSMKRGLSFSILTCLRHGQSPIPSNRHFIWMYAEVCQILMKRMRGRFS